MEHEAVVHWEQLRRQHLSQNHAEKLMETLGSSMYRQHRPDKDMLDQLLRTKRSVSMSKLQLENWSFLNRRDVVPLKAFDTFRKRTNRVQQTSNDRHVEQICQHRSNIC